MSIGKRVSVAFTGAAAMAATGLAAPAYAAPASAWHITPGNSTIVTLTNTTDLTVTAGNGATLTCKHATFHAHISGDGTTSPSAPLFTIGAPPNGSPEVSCSLASIPFTFRLKKPLQAWATQYSNGFITGHLGGGATSDISASINAAGRFPCHAEIRGSTLPAKYVNANHSLDINSGHAATLHTTSVQGCLGLLNSGDPAYFAGGFSVNPPISITRSA